MSQAQTLVLQQTASDTTGLPPDPVAEEKPTAECGLLESQRLAKMESGEEWENL